MPNIVSQYIAREIFPQIAAHLEAPEITIISGSRQVGKSVLLEQLRSFLLSHRRVPAENILFYNLDLVRDAEILRDQGAFIDHLRSRSQDRRLYVFVDEAQKVPEAPRYFKGVYDSHLNVKLILTGSSALEIQAQFKETLAGRKRTFLLQPFSFAEYLSASDPALSVVLKKADVSTIDERELIRKYKEYAVFGGYPRVVLATGQEEKISVLRELYGSYVERDVKEVFEIKNKHAFTRLIKLLAAQTGQLVDISELATVLAIDRQTVERYITALEETFIIRRVPPYFRNPRQEIVKAGKIYFFDSGIRHTALERFELFDERTDIGHVLENSVFSHLQALCGDAGKLRFWRTKQGAEVDFIIERGLELTAVEVKHVAREKHVPTGLKSFASKFHPNTAVVVNLGVHNDAVQVESTDVLFAYPFELERLVC